MKKFLQFSGNGNSKHYLISTDNIQYFEKINNDILIVLNGGLNITLKNISMETIIEMINE